MFDFGVQVKSGHGEKGAESAAIFEWRGQGLWQREVRLKMGFVMREQEVDRNHPAQDDADRGGTGKGIREGGFLGGIPAIHTERGLCGIQGGIIGGGRGFKA
jgi:hypothetical protein